MNRTVEKIFVCLGVISVLSSMALFAWAGVLTPEEARYIIHQSGYVVGNLEIVQGYNVGQWAAIGGLLFGSLLLVGAAESWYLRTIYSPCPIPRKE